MGKGTKMDFLRRAWAEIDLDALDHNLEQIKACTPGKKIIGVVKANAYGHDDGIVSAELYEQGIRFFAVSNVLEAIAIREHLPYGDVKIIVFGYVLPPYLDAIVEYNLIVTAGSVEYAKMLDDYAKSRGEKIKVHINLDTGMSRVGVNTDEEIDEIIGMNHLDVCGGYSHFAVSDQLDENNAEFTEKQEEKLAQAFVTRGIPFHSQASGGIVFHKDFPGDFTRPGLILYGCAPNTSVETPIKLKQVMTFKSAVNQLKVVKKGTDIGYGRTYTTDSDQLIALVPVGYADGYNRLLSNKGLVAINGVLCHIRGRVCMDQMMVDVTGIPDVKIGDEVLLYSDKFKETSLDHIADITGTIANETICAVSARVPRVAVRGGKVVQVVNYR